MMKKAEKRILLMLFLCVFLCAGGKSVAAAEQTPPASNPEESINPTNTLQKVDGKLYYYDSAGNIVRNTLKKVNGNYYYFDSKGRAITQKWKTLSKKKYYFKKNGTAATESNKINGKYYVFNRKGQLLTPKKNSRKTVNNTCYYVNSKGNPVTGWHTLSGNKVIYVHKNGRCAANETVEGVRFGSDAYAKNKDQAMAKVTAKKFIRKYTKSSDSKSKKLKKCAWRIVATFSYTGSQRCKGFTKSDWVYRAAVEALTTDSGDCFYIAASIGAIADALGYKNVSVIHLSRSHAYVRIGTKGNYVYYDNMGPIYGGKKPHYTTGKIKRTFTFKS